MDPIKDARERDRNRAIKFIKHWVKANLKNYQEPERKGTPKGEPIGFSRDKMRAALFMILYPNACTLKEIAALASIPGGVLRAWKIQDDFKEEQKEKSDLLASGLIDMFEREVMEKYLPVLPKREAETLKEKWEKKPSFEFSKYGIEPADLLIFFANILPFLNSSLTLSVMEGLNKQGPKTSGLPIPEPLMEYVSWYMLILRNLNVRRQKDLKKWRKSPGVLDLKKMFIKRSIYSLIGATKAKLPQKKIVEFAELLIKAIFETLDNLAS